MCEKNAKISWTQVETGSAITWKYPSVVLKGDNSVGEFYSIAVTNNHQQVDTGTKMIHLGKNTKSTIISKGISAGKSNNSYRGLVQISARAENARNFSQCDSLLMGNNCGAHTFPYIESKNPSAKIIALRADMDALPIQETNKTDYVSQNAGVMHACGHDVHTSSLLGVASVLQQLKSEFSGTVKLLFQPGEEKLPGGA